MNSSNIKIKEIFQYKSNETASLIFPDLELIFYITSLNSLMEQQIEEIKKTISQFFGKIAIDENATLPFYFNSQYSFGGNGLINLLSKINRDLYSKNQTLPWASRQSFSVITAVNFNDVYSVVSVGGGDAYQILPNLKLSTLTFNDTLAGHFGEKQPEINLPLSAIGNEENLTFQIKEFKIQHNTTIIFSPNEIYDNLHTAIHNAPLNFNNFVSENCCLIACYT